MKVNLNVFPYCHSYYQEIINNPPEDVEYTGLFEFGETSYVDSGNLTSRTLLYLDNLGERLWDLIDTPSFRPALRGPLVHSERLVLGRTPYVVSFDHVGFLTDYRFDRLYRLRDSGVLSRYLSSSRCRRLLPWSNAAQQSLEALVGEWVAEKSTVVYPAVRARDIPVRRDNERVNLLFVASDFHLKGGLEVLEAFQRLRPHHDVRLTVVADVPADVRAQYTWTDIDVRPPDFTREELYSRVYSEADVLLLPTHNDSFGMVLLEAMNAGLPVVATDVFATDEIVIDGETGYLLDTPETCLFDEDCLPREKWSDKEAIRRSLSKPEEAVVDQLVDNTRRLIESPDRRYEFGLAAQDRVHDGPFSVSRRNATLRRVYQDAAGVDG